MVCYLLSQVVYYYYYYWSISKFSRE